MPGWAAQCAPSLSPPSLFYEELKAQTYHPLLAERELDALRWRVVAMGAMQPRTTRPYQKYPDMIVYTGAATSMHITCALVLGLGRYKSLRAINGIISMADGQLRKATFNKSNYIYALEMLALLSLAIGPMAGVDGNAIVFHLDNDNASKSLAGNKSGTRAVQVATLLIRHILSVVGLEHSLDGSARIATRLASIQGVRHHPF